MLDARLICEWLSPWRRQWHNTVQANEPGDECTAVLILKRSRVSLVRRAPVHPYGLRPPVERTVERAARARTRTRRRACSWMNWSGFASKLDTFQ